MAMIPPEQQKAMRSKKCTDEGVLEGFKAAAIGAVVTTPTMLYAVRKISWAKHNLNYTAQALIISAATIASYFITADKQGRPCHISDDAVETGLTSEGAPKF